MILTRFPQPSGAILKALSLLAISRDGDPDEMAEAGDLSELPRPWEPASCPEELRAGVWHWCDSVAGWLNTDLAWRPAQIIPDCWPRHPHLARELPILAILRWQAEEALDPRWLEEWHRYTYPAFLDRLAVSLGESTCRAGKHQDWPARARVSAFLRGAEQRLRFLQADAASTPDSTSRFG